MRRLLFCLSLAALPAIGDSLASRTAPITLYADFQQDPPPAVLEAIQSELASIMSPIGLHFEWRSLKANRGNEVSVELAVVTFRGKCNTASLEPVGGSPGALGWTHVSDGVILPFSDIDCDGIRRFVQSGLLHVDAEAQEETYGRAVGRVLAHELYHIFANTQHHGAHGVGKAAYTAKELLSKVFHFEQGEFQALRTGKAKAVLAGSAGGQ